MKSNLFQITFIIHCEILMKNVSRQEALSSAVSEKDAHLAWLEVTGEGNVHTKTTIDRLRKERRELLQRMKDEVMRDYWQYQCNCVVFSLSL